jgi:hypothetical protein
MEITTRPISPEERARLERRDAPAVPAKGDAIFATLLTAFPIWFALLYGILLLPNDDLLLTVYTFGTLIGMLFVSFRFHMKRAEKAVRARNVKGAAEDDARIAAYRTIQHVEVWTVRVVDALEVEIDEDTGSQFYLEMDDGRVLVLDEEWLERNDVDLDGDVDADGDGDDEPSPWAPNRALSVTRLPLPHSFVFDVRCIGEFFPPSQTRETTVEEWASDAIRVNGDVLPGPLSRYTFA